eukprot:10960390-Alexandrium_andersonii.AAC.1
MPGHARDPVCERAFAFFGEGCGGEPPEAATVAATQGWENGNYSTGCMLRPLRLTWSKLSGIHLHMLGDERRCAKDAE